MKDYKNVIVLRDNDSRDGNIDLIIFTNESTETIESAIDELRKRWCENEYDWCLIDEIIEYLTCEYDCVVYARPFDEIWY
jgi:hypothetical protein